MDKQALMDKMMPAHWMYRYHDCIRFNGGGEVNGSKPIEAIPLYTIDQVLAFIQSTPARDEVLEEARTYKYALHLLHAIADREFPEIGVEPMSNTLGVLTQIDHLTASMARRCSTFTRTDGTTSPLRGTVEDRRKSAKGGDARGGTKYVLERDNADDSLNRYGLRAGDRARWTGEAAPVRDLSIPAEWTERKATESGSDECAAGMLAADPFNMMSGEAVPVVEPKKWEPDNTWVPWTVRQPMTNRVECMRRSWDEPLIWTVANIHPETNIAGLYWREIATQPAQEAPQPKKPGLVEAFEARRYLGQTLDQWTAVKDCETRCAFSWLLRELDARQGEK